MDMKAGTANGLSGKSSLSGLDGIGQTKRETVRAISENLNIRKEIVEAVLLELYQITKLRLTHHNRARTPFGILTLKETTSRLGRNPRTGEAVEVKAGKKVKFKAGQGFMRDLLAHSSQE